MTLVEVVLLIIVIVCLIALICIISRQKASDEDVVVVPKDFRELPEVASDRTVSTTSGTTANKPDMPIGVKTHKLSQNTIYEFDAKSVKCRCPFCDGENSFGSEICGICGRNL